MATTEELQVKGSIDVIGRALNTIGRALVDVEGAVDKISRRMDELEKKAAEKEEKPEKPALTALDAVQRVKAILMNCAHPMWHAEDVKMVHVKREPLGFMVEFNDGAQLYFEVDVFVRPGARSVHDAKE